MQFTSNVGPTLCTESFTFARLLEAVEDVKLTYYMLVSVLIKTDKTIFVNVEYDKVSVRFICMHSALCYVSCSVLTLLNVLWEEHPTCKNLLESYPKVLPC